MINVYYEKYRESSVRDSIDNTYKILEKGYYTDEEIDTIYTFGYYLFICGKYQEAKNVFIKITQYSNDLGYIWRAIGAVNQQMNKYLEAIQAYTTAIEYDPDDAVSYCYCGESQILSGNIKSGIESLRNVLRIRENTTPFDPWVLRAKNLIRVHET